MLKRIALIFPVAGLVALAVTAARSDEEANQLQALVAKVAPSIATVKAVVKTEFKGGGQSQDQESRVTLQGLVVAPDGLIMVTNMPFSPKRLMQMMGGGDEMPEGLNIKMTPTAFKITFEQEVKEYDGFLAATDTTLDLAFVKVEGLGDRKLTPVDFGSSTPPTIGQKVVAISRLQKGFDFAPYFQVARVSGEINKPRKAWMLDGSISSFGLPVFAENGDVLGVLTTVVSASKEDNTGDNMGFAMMMRMFGGGGGMPGGAFVLPGQTIKTVVDQAGKRAVEVAAERAKRQAEKPVTPVKPATATTTKPTPPKAKP